MLCRECASERGWLGSYPFDGYFPASDVVAQTPVGLFYADCDNAEAIRFGRDELNLLKTLRNQAVLAIRQHS